MITALDIAQRLHDDMTSGKLMTVGIGEVRDAIRLAREESFSLNAVDDEYLELQVLKKLINLTF